VEVKKNAIQGIGRVENGFLMQNNNRLCKTSKGYCPSSGAVVTKGMISAGSGSAGSSRPQRSTRFCAMKRRVADTEGAQKLSGHEASGPALPKSIASMCAECDYFAWQQSVLVASGDHSVSEQDPRRPRLCNDIPSKGIAVWNDRSGRLSRCVSFVCSKTVPVANTKMI